MSVPPEILFAIAAMVLWGAEEFFLKEAITGLRSITTIFINTIAGGLLSVIIVIFFLDSKLFLISGADFGLAGLAATTAFLGYIFFYRALEKQELSLISALDESWIVIAVIIGVVAFGEKLSIIHAVAIAAVILGAFFVSANFSRLRGLKFISGSGYEGLAIFFIGLSVPLEKVLVGRIGETNAIIYLYALYFPLIFISKMIMKEKFVKPSAKLLRQGVISGLADGSAFVFYLLAINTGDVSIVSPIVASNIVVAVILGRVYLREKLNRKEILGIIIILLGVIVLSRISVNAV